MSLRDLYLADLKKEVSYDGRSRRPRVRKPSQYEKIPETTPWPMFHYPNIWVWSDTHFGHKNIIKYCDRPFFDNDEMTETLIANHNEVVGDNDLVIWVGDVAFMGDAKANEILARLKGDRILVVGNHDMNKGKVKNLDFLEKHLLLTMDGDPPLVFTHFPFENCPPEWINIHGHIHNSYESDSLQHINVSVEVIDYKPVHLYDLIRTARTRWNSMENISEPTATE